MLFENGDRVLFTGDSITDAGRGRPIGEGLHDGVGSGYVRCVESLVNLCYPEKHVRITNTGIGGDNVLALGNRWQTDVMDLKPDWLSICIGGNDVWRQFDSPGITSKHITPDVYRETLTNLVQQAKPATKGIILMTPYYIEPLKADAMRAKMDEYGAIVKEISNANNTMFVDLQTAFDDYLQYRHSSYLSWDRVHPNNVACMLIARAFLKTVGFDRTYL